MEWDEWVRTAFEVFDVDGAGRLSVEDLNKLLCGDVCAVRYLQWCSTSALNCASTMERCRLPHQRAAGMVVCMTSSFEHLAVKC